MSEPKDENGGSCSRAWKLLAEIEEELEAFSVRELARLQDEFGPSVLVYARDTPAAIEACGSSDLATRTLALTVLTITGKVGPGLPEVAFRIIQSENPSELKSFACSVLPLCYAHGLPFAYLESLFPVLLDGRTEADLRVWVYNAARLIHHALRFVGQPFTPEAILFPSRVTSIDDIDWPWVRSTWAQLVSPRG